MKKFFMKIRLFIFSKKLRIAFLKDEPFYIKSFFLSVWPKKWSIQYLDSLETIEKYLLSKDISNEKKGLMCDSKLCKSLSDSVRYFKKSYKKIIQRETHSIKIPEIPENLNDRLDKNISVFKNQVYYQRMSDTKKEIDLIDPVIIDKITDNVSDYMKKEGIRL
jgi:hypothetical protein